MSVRIRELLEPPVFERDEEQTRLASLIHAFQLAVLALAAAIVLLRLITAPDWIGPAAFAVLILLWLVGSYLMRRGRVQMVGWSMAATLWVGCTVLSASSGGITSPFFIGCITATLFAGSVVGRGGTLTFAILTTVTGLGLLYADRTGVLDPHPIATTPLITWAILIANLIIAGFLLHLVAVGLIKAASDAQSYVGMLEEQTSHLESVVLERTHALERRGARLEAAAQVAREASEILQTRQLLRRTVRLISEEFGFYHAGIFLLDDMGEYAVLRAASSEGGQRMLARGHKLRIGQVGIVGNVAATGQPRIALKVGEDATYFDNPFLPTTQSEIALPLKVRGRVIGVLDVQSTEPEAFIEEDVAVLQTMADQVALALENARLLVEAQDRLRETGALLGHQSADAWSRLATERERWSYLYDGVEVIETKDGSLADAKHHLTADLKVRDADIGRIRVSLGDRDPTPEELALINTVAEQAGLALENSRLFRETQRALGESETLYRASAGLTAAQSYEDVLQVLREHTLLGQGDKCAITRFDRPWTEQYMPKWIEMIAVWEEAEEPLFTVGGRVSLSLFPVLRQLRASNPTVIIADVENDPRLDEQSRTSYIHGMQARAVLLIPMAIGGNAVGWIGALYDNPTEFPRTDLRLLTSLSGQAAVTIQSIGLLEDTRTQAERERVVADITAQVRASTEVDTILRTAIRELGRALGASDGLIRLDVGDGDGDSPVHEAVATGDSSSGTGGSHE
jgi:GAF domain-containing protein